MSDYEIIFIATNPIYTIAMYKLFHIFFEEHIYDKKIEIISYIIYDVLLSIMVIVTRIPLIMLIFNVLFSFLISLNYISSIKKKIIAVSLVYSILFVIEINVSAAIGFLHISIYKNSLFESIVGIMLIRIITIIVAYLLNRYIKAIKKDLLIPKVYYLAFSIVLFGTLYLFVGFLENDSITIFNVIFSGTILIIVNMTMIMIDEKIYNSIIETNEKKILKQQNIAYENQAEIMNQSTQTIKSLNHDMKNHLMMLSKMYTNNKKDEIEAYIEKILDSINTDIFSQSDNFVIDSIINFKLRNLQDTDSKINLEIIVPQVINILAYDLTIILGNLLDNAITAMEQSNDKSLNLRISCSIGNLIILMDNSFNGYLIMENGEFKTTKIIKSNHGIGLTNIEKSLENYGGEIRTEYTSDTFSVAVIIPIVN